MPSINQSNAYSVLTNPSTSAVNTITPQSISVVGLTVRGLSGQSANLQEWQQSNGTVLSAIDSAGNISLSGTSPIISSTNSSGSVIRFLGSGGIGITQGNVLSNSYISLGFNTGGSKQGAVTVSSGIYGWVSSLSDSTGVPDAMVSRRTTANIQLGAVDAAAPIAQTLSVQSVIAGTSNTAGVNWTFAGSQGTGTGAGGSLIFQVAPVGSTGTSQNSLINVLTIDATRLVTISSTDNHTVSANDYGLKIIRSGTISNNTIGVKNINLDISNTVVGGGTQGVLNVGINVVVSGGSTNTGITIDNTAASAGGLYIGNGTPTGATSIHIASTQTRAVLLNRTEIGTGSTDGSYIGIGSDGTFNLVQQEAANIVFTANGGNHVLSDGSSTSSFRQVTGATNNVMLNNGGVSLRSDGNFTFCSTTNAAGTGDAFIGRRTTAGIMLGATDAASPVAQTLSVQSVVAGTSNTAGVNFTIAASQGTGTGAGGSLIFKTAPAGTTGSSQNALVAGLTIDSTQTSTFGNDIIIPNLKGIILDGGSSRNIANVSGYLTFGSLSGGAGIAFAANGGTVSVTGWGAITPTQFSVVSGSSIGWSNGTGDARTLDTMMSRPNAANIQQGGADAASPVAQTLSVQSVVGGTSNTAGAQWNLVGSLGTGTGVPGRVHIQGGALAQTGTTKQTAIDRHIVGATKVLTNANVIALANCTLASNTAVGGLLDYTIEVFDGTNVQYEAGTITYGAINKGGVFSNNVCLKSANQQAFTSGSLTVTFTITAANPAVISVNANSSLTPSTGYPRITYDLRNLSQQAVSVQ